MILKIFKPLLWILQCTNNPNDFIIFNSRMKKLCWDMFEASKYKKKISLKFYWGKFSFKLQYFWGALQFFAVPNPYSSIKFLSQENKLHIRNINKCRNSLIPTFYYFLQKCLLSVKFSLLYIISFFIFISCHWENTFINLSVKFLTNLRTQTSFFQEVKLGRNNGNCT